MRVFCAKCGVYVSTTGTECPHCHFDTLIVVPPPPRALDDLLQRLYDASAYSDPSRIGPALDNMLEYVEYWSVVLPEHVVTLFDRLEPSRLVRAVGQTLLASTKLDGDRSSARQAFIVRFLEDLRIRGTSENTIARLRKGLES